ncbi:Iron-sulfur cluster assembly 1-like, mitochondrial [Oryzias melastigma]|uniref:Iron-sulfur cluster assembly 1 homolog, mitochondrial n=1 Tax=Oryzias melastigma TaxID=30732 RepID=A0A834FRM9_ORYME|nr:Iron-sulfur cluster assembly 1-like, mitochondrial [Oryzias melastigma]
MKDCSMRQKSRPRRDSEKRPENQQENMDGDESRDVFRKRNEHHRKRDPLEQRCCFLCGSTAHIKKDCQLYNNTAVRATVRAVNKRKILATRAALTLTPAAVNKIRTLLQDKPEYIGLKVGVRTRGCNGLTYTLNYTKEKDKSDEEVLQDGVTVFIEKKAQLTLLGTEMDFVESKLSSEFIFNNPNIKGTCGCGESFNI